MRSLRGIASSIVLVAACSGAGSDQGTAPDTAGGAGSAGSAPPATAGSAGVAGTTGGAGSAGSVASAGAGGATSSGGCTPGEQSVVGAADDPCVQQGTPCAAAGGATMAVCEATGSWSACTCVMPHPPNGTCGNGTVDPGEECDGTNLNGRTCASKVGRIHLLTCNEFCDVDINACSEGTRWPYCPAPAICTAVGGTAMLCTDGGQAGDMPPECPPDGCPYGVCNQGQNGTVPRCLLACEP